MKEKSNWKKRLLEKLHFKYRLVIMDHETLEEKLSFRLSRFNVFVISGTLSVVLIILTTIIIAYTPLREYIPGYATVDVQKEIYNLRLKADSLDSEFKQKDLYIYNMKRILEGKEVVDKMPSDAEIKKEIKEQKTEVAPEDVNPTSNDSLFRVEFESQMKYFGAVQNTNKSNNNQTTIASNSDPLKNIFFFTPLRGYVTNVFNLAIKHYGIDIVAQPNESINAVLDGTVIFAGWTVKTGYTIAIQHKNNIISVYKHNSTLLK